MARNISQPFVVLGAILEKNGKFLLVKEAGKKRHDAGKWNQPAGWLEHGEEPLEAVKREVKEETGFDFQPKAVLGLYSLLRNDLRGILNPVPHPVKIIFTGEINDNNQTDLADDISEIKWFSPEEIQTMDKHTLRDLDIKKEVQDYLAGKRYPLEFLKHTIS